MMDEDQLYGACREAGAYGIAPHETTAQPRSWMTLTAETAPAIRRFFQERQEPGLFNPIPPTCHVLWLMDGEARLHLALEEIIDGDGILIGVLPRAVKAQPVRPFLKLGHPTLIPSADKRARIAGEIVHDPDMSPDGRRPWCLTNASGRYGLRPWQTRDHLEAVSRYFEGFGLYFTTWFQQPRKVT